MAVYAFDTESGAAGTLLENHPLTCGGSWVKGAGQTGSMALTTNGTSRLISSMAAYYVSGTPSGSDYDVEEDMYFPSVGSYRLLILRGNVSGNLGYMGGYDNGGNWTIYKETGPLQFSPAAVKPGETHHVKFSARGSTLTLYVDGVQVVTATDSSYTAPGQAGIFGYGPGANDNTGAQGKNFCARIAPAPGVEVPSLTVTAASATTSGGQPVAITASLTKSTASLTASVTGGLGAVSTTTPASGTPFLYYPPKVGSGTGVVTLVAAAEGLVQSCSVSYISTPSFTAKMSTSGQFLVVTCTDNAGSPSFVMAVGPAAGVSITVGGQATPLGPPIWGARSPDSAGNPTAPAYCPDLLYPVPASIGTIPTTATVTFSAPAGFVTTIAGKALAVNNLPVANPGSLLPAVPAKPRTLTLGYNITGDYYGSAGRIYSDFNKGSSFILSPNILATDANGYPTKIKSGFLFNMTDLGFDYGGSGKGNNAAPQGRYRVVWDGPSVKFSPFPQNATTTAAIISTSIGKATGNEIVIEFRDSTNFAPAFGLNMMTTQPPGSDGTYSCDLQNLRVYPPDPADPTGNTPWANPTKYYPSLKTQFGPATCWRWMDGGAINNSNARTIADIVPYARMGYPHPIRYTTATVAKVEPYTGTDPFVRASGANRLLITTTAPHGFADGESVTLGAGIGTVQSTSGSFDLTNQTAVIKVASPTTFIFGGYAGAATSAMTNTLAPTGTNPNATVMVSGGGIPWDDCGNLSAYLDADLWRNIAHLLPDSVVATLARNDAATLPAGKKVILEWSNEVWNDAFLQKTYASSMSRSVLGSPGDYDYLSYQVYRSIQVHRAYIAAWVAAGRSASDVVRYIGSAPGSDGTAQIIALAKGPATSTFQRADGALVSCTIDLANGTTTVVTTPSGGTPATTRSTFPGLGAFQIDAVGPSLYIDNNPIPEASLKPIFDTLSVDQDLDIFEYLVAGGSLGADLAAHAAAIKSAGLPYPVSLEMYEFNVQGMMPLVVASGDQNQTPNQGPRSVAIHRHPRMAAIFSAILQQCQDAGVSRGNVYYLNGGNYYGQWDTYNGISMTAGTGDRTVDAANVTDPGNIPRIRSEIGGAVNRWMAPTTPATPVKPRRVPPTRGARPRASGSRAW